MSKIFVTNFNNNKYNKIWAKTSPKFKKHLTETDFSIYLQGYRTGLGKIEYIDEPILTKNFAVFKIYFKKYIYYLLMIIDKNDNFTMLSFVPELSNLPVPIYQRISSKTTVKQLAKNYLRINTTSGLAIGIIKEGKIKSYFFGSTSKKVSIKPNTDTIFEIGDLTKLFTATAFLELSIKKIINLDDSPDKYLTPFIQGNKSLKNISMVDLLAHRSGLPLVPDNMLKLMKDPADPYKGYTKTKLYKYLKDYKNISSKENKKYSYSSLGYGLIGLILELKTGLCYPEIIHKEVTQKLGMKHTAIFPTSGNLAIMAKGYNINGDKTSIWSDSVLNSAYALKSTLGDMIVFLQENLYPKGDALGKAIILGHKDIPTNSQKEQNHTSITYGGWEKIEIGDSDVLWKCGATGGFSCGIAFFKNHKNGVIVLSNSAVDVSDLIIKLLEYLSMKVEAQNTTSTSAYQS